MYARPARWAKLRIRLESRVAKLLTTANELPPGQDRHNAPREVGKFRVRITAVQRGRLTIGS